MHVTFSDAIEMLTLEPDGQSASIIGDGLKRLLAQDPVYAERALQLLRDDPTGPVAPTLADGITAQVGRNRAFAAKLSEADKELIASQGEPVPLRYRRAGAPARYGKRQARTSAAMRSSA